MTSNSKLKVSYNTKELHIAYKQLTGTKEVSLIFFGGLHSNMNSTKATALYDYCKYHNLSLILFDYLGHGESDGIFTDYNISDWYKNCIDVINQLTSPNELLIIIGSSMGAWIMLLVALSHPHKISHLIGLAGAPDFTESLIFNKLTTIQKDELHKYNQLTLSSNSNDNYSYIITKNLIEDGRKHLLLNQESINIESPITLIHGMNDNTVPYNISITLAEKVKSQNVNLHLIKSANHNLSDDTSLNILFKCVKKAIEQVTINTK